MNDGRAGSGRASHSRTWLTRTLFGRLSSYGFHAVGRTPPISTSDPGQNMDDARRPCLIAVTQSGSPPHQRGSFAVSADIVNRSPMTGSHMLFEMMPWWSG